MEDKIDYQQLGKLAIEFENFLTEIESFYQDTVIGSCLLKKHINKDQKQFQEFFPSIDETLLDDCSFDYSNFIKNDIFSVFYNSKQGKIKNRNGQNSSHVFYLGRMCMVLMYGFWEDYLRKPYTKSLGLDKFEDDFWGDLAKIRHSVLKKKD